MEVIEISSYTDVEKFYIAKNYIIPKIYEEFTEKKAKIFVFKDSAIKKIIHEYTLEPGVRELERQLRNVVRKATLEFTKTNKTVVITPEKVVEYLGPEKIREEDSLEKTTRWHRDRTCLDSKRRNNTLHRKCADTWKWATDNHWSAR